MTTTKRKVHESASSATTSADKKHRLGSNNLAVDQTHSSMSQSAIEDFPRGGALPLDALEFREVADKASKDVLFDVSPENDHQAASMNGLAEEAFIQYF